MRFSRATPRHVMYFHSWKTRQLQCVQWKKPGTSSNPSSLPRRIVCNVASSWTWGTYMISTHISLKTSKILQCSSNPNHVAWGDNFRSWAAVYWCLGSCLWRRIILVDLSLSYIVMLIARCHFFEIWVWHLSQLSTPVQPKILQNVSSWSLMGWLIRKYWLHPSPTNDQMI